MMIYQDRQFGTGAPKLIATAEPNDAIVKIDHCRCCEEVIVRMVTDGPRHVVIDFQLPEIRSILLSLQQAGLLHGVMPIVTD